MPYPFESKKTEQPSTYFVQDRQNESEFTRLILQDQMLTAAMGGNFSEQPEPKAFRRVLDVGCGTGGWLLQAAQTYPDMSLFGIDISKRMIDYAREQAAISQHTERVEFQVMDALRMLEFPKAFFDLVNMRFGFSFLRTWDWPKMLSEMQRVARPGGIIRITDSAIQHISNSPALTQLQQMAICAFLQAGHIFEQERLGVLPHLERLLTRYGVRRVQTKAYSIEFRAGTSEGQAYAEDMGYVYKTIRPFLKKWGCLAPNYDEIYRQAIEEMQQSDFCSSWDLLTAWGERD
ncbi:class I SAM-dependent methyltransferase [Ktedonosporobacter rubrisoli]|uniref:Class I SAM-dependent methyltransferase n=1 Tax=Ktedonosporobacter rubrisoli TaxID=2509675 RepID=A0A4P6JNB6_KTERU|nr:class I SAM-dependent methyltransferase [Ktedonosporobacter rubrisoli]QBD76798.1 class I SAM-dependent methyltransferase [Ktedonosporobacter rubrisoli]